MSQSNGIATLLKAEKEAHEIVASARRYRQERLKQAKLDASQEISEYRRRKEQELQEYEAANAGGAEELEREAEQRAQKELDEIRRVASAKRDAVLELLIDAVTKPQHELHVNAG
ncbi:AaceriAAL076Wp [[Ashbya] aceris (nom. inval.)]|nr:AaceriAAL076Wp [[Ashbya] aceris (nom. inval.)]